MGRQLFPPVGLDLVHFQWAERVRIGGGAIIHIQSPQRADESDRAPGGLELEAIFGWLCKMPLGRGGGDPAPTENVIGAQRPQFREITRWILRQRHLPTRGVWVHCKGAQRGHNEVRRFYSAED